MMRESWRLMLVLVLLQGLSRVAGSYQGLTEHTNCEGAHSCKSGTFDDDDNTCSGTLLSEYCSSGFACCEDSTRCKYSRGKCVNLETDGCSSGKIVLGYCEDWEGSEPFGVFCCDDDGYEDFLDKQIELVETSWAMFWICFTFMFLSPGPKLFFFFSGLSWIILVSMTAAVGAEYGPIGSVILGSLCCFIFAIVSVAFSVAIHEKDDERMGLRIMGAFSHMLLVVVPLLYMNFDISEQTISEADLYGTPVLPTFGPSQLPTSQPSYQPTSQPTTEPTFFSNNPTITLSPSLQPSMTYSPSSSCPLGSDMLGGCNPCPKGEYGDLIGCHDCPSWKWSSKDGSTSCDLYAVDGEIEESIVIALCTIYCVLSLVCFVFYVRKTKNWIAIVTVFMITADQITDFLFAYYTPFANFPIMICAGVFCMLNLLAQGLWLVARVSPSNLYICKWEVACWDYLNNLDEDYNGWVLHNLLGFNKDITRSFLVVLLMCPLDIVWVFLRLLIPVAVALIAAVVQLLLLMAGMIFSTTKLMSTPQVFNSFWTLWNPSFLETNKEELDHSTMYNALVVAEMILENLPELTIQIWNSYHLSDWPTLTIVSLVFSATMILAVLNHFRYHFMHRDRNKSFRFSEVPKFDIIVEMAAVTDKDRADRRSSQKQEAAGETSEEAETALEICVGCMKGW